MSDDPSAMVMVMGTRAQVAAAPRAARPRLTRGPSPRWHTAAAVPRPGGRPPPDPLPPPLPPPPPPPRPGPPDKLPPPICAGGQQTVQISPGVYKCVDPYSTICPPGYHYKGQANGSPLCGPTPQIGTPGGNPHSRRPPGGSLTAAPSVLPGRGPPGFHGWLNNPTGPLGVALPTPGPQAAMQDCLQDCWGLANKQQYDACRQACFCARYPSTCALLAQPLPGQPSTRPSGRPGFSGLGAPRPAGGPCNTDQLGKSCKSMFGKPGIWKNVCSGKTGCRCVCLWVGGQIAAPAGGVQPSRPTPPRKKKRKRGVLAALRRMF